MNQARQTSTVTAATTTPTGRLLKRSEVEDWFHKNLKAVEASKFLKAKDKFQQGTQVTKDIQENSTLIKQVDPVF